MDSVNCTSTPASVAGSFPDAVFHDLFIQPKNLQQLYLSLHPEDNSAAAAIPGSLTLKGTVDGHNNTVGFTILNRLIVLEEAPADWTADVMLTLLNVTAETMQNYLMLTEQNLYGEKAVHLPKQELCVLCTGTPQERPEWLNFAEDFTNWSEPYMFNFGGKRKMPLGHQKKGTSAMCPGGKTS